MIYICVIGINRLQFCFSVTILVSLYILSKQIVTLLSASFFLLFLFFRSSWSDEKGKIHMSIEFFVMTWYSSKHGDFNWIWYSSISNLITILWCRSVYKIAWYGISFKVTFQNTITNAFIHEIKILRIMYQT